MNHTLTLFAVLRAAVLDLTREGQLTAYNEPPRTTPKGATRKGRSER